MGARYYDPMGGRFLSTDPIGCPININLYAYANGDPINYFDPDGRFHSPAYKTVQPSTFGIRAMGVLRGVGGMFETAGGGAFALGTAPTGIGFVGGSLLMAHGLDNTMTGFRQAFSGRVAESATSQLLQKTGLSQNHASLIDDGIGMFGPMAAIAITNRGIQIATAGTRQILLSAETFVSNKAASKGVDVFHVTPHGVVIPFDKKYQIPKHYIENRFRSGSYGELVDGSFLEKLRIDPPTLPGKKGPNYSHYHLNNKGTHYSPKSEQNPGFDP